ncbi:MAG: phosphoribosylaminoimidazolesuccinocarboxamide synthase, partial [Acidimicrobiales bacterium]
KGRVLTGLTAHWLAQVDDIVPNHLISVDGASMLVRKADMLPIECIVRGYLSGSAWKEYLASGTMHGSALPAGLAESARLPEPRFTPSTKAATGHDQNISREEAAALVGADVARAAEQLSLAAYERGAARAAERGIIIADTKLELGFIDGELAICDEVLTPDSSRFWPADAWVEGGAPPSYDKQPVRDWLEATGWDKSPPPPHLPPDVVAASAQRYATAYERLTGSPLSEWDGGRPGSVGAGSGGGR